MKQLDPIDVFVYFSGMLLWLLVAYASFFVHKDYIIVSNNRDIIHRHFEEEECKIVKKNLEDLFVVANCIKVE